MSNLDKVKFGALQKHGKDRLARQNKDKPEKAPATGEPAGPDKTLSFKVDYETWRRLKMLCMEQNMTLNELLIKAAEKLAKTYK